MLFISFALSPCLAFFTLYTYNVTAIIIHTNTTLAMAITTLIPTDMELPCGESSTIEFEVDKGGSRQLGIRTAIIPVPQTPKALRTH